MYNQPMSEYYSTIKLSENIEQNDDVAHGFLRCNNVPIARTGELKYLPSETQIDSSTGITLIRRDDSELFGKETMKSFEGKALTMFHPENGVFVDSKNYKKLEVGTIINIRRGTENDRDKLIADLMVKEPSAIVAIKTGKIRQISLGYNATFNREGDGRGNQTNMIGNHAALVPEGRCGAECAILDSMANFFDEDEQGGEMADRKSLMDLFRSRKSIDAKIEKQLTEGEEMNDSDKSELAELRAMLSKVLDAKEAEKKAADADEEEKKKKAADAEEESKAEDESLSPAMKKMADGIEKLSKRFDAFELKGNASKSNDNAIMSYSQKDMECAEILAPGIPPTADMRARALDNAMSTEYGKQVIDSLLDGEKLADANINLLFRAAASEIGRKRVSDEYAHYNAEKTKTKAKDSNVVKIKDSATTNDDNKSVWDKIDNAGGA